MPAKKSPHTVLPLTAEGDMIFDANEMHVATLGNEVNIHDGIDTEDNALDRAVFLAHAANNFGALEAGLAHAVIALNTANNFAVPTLGAGMTSHKLLPILEKILANTQLKRSA